MNTPATTFPTPTDFARLFLRYPARWIIPLVLVAAGGAAYALLRPDTWEASQALVVRNEANGNLSEPGKFRHSDELKAILETVLEVSKTPNVARDTLVAVGPPSDRQVAGPWPSEQEVADFSDTIKLAPPKGAEYGKTEMFYLKVRDRERPRALKLTEVLCKEIETRFAQLRGQRAGSLVDELEAGVQLAQTDLAATTVKLKQLEASVGSDLSELRHLHQGGGGSESDLRRRSLELENELRQAVIIEANRKVLLAALEEAQTGRGGLQTIPNGLLETQPTLKKLIEGLIDAQVRTSQLLGTMSTEHPLVRAAKISEQEISDHLHAELATAIRGLRIDIQLAHDRVDSLNEQRDESRERLVRLAGLRAEYTNLIAESEQRSKYLSEMERKLVEAKAVQASTVKTSLISRVDGPETGPKPVGPGRTTLLAASLAGGLAVGVGVLLLTAPAGFGARPANQTVIESASTETNAPAKRLSLKQALARVTHPAA
ncbi:MAG: hypothetical protein JSS27_16270 [Planctomycetes bacterium]|nr:hypothetical protein [Planctomycetota bacterium]